MTYSSVTPFFDHCMKYEISPGLFASALGVTGLGLRMTGRMTMAASLGMQIYSVGIRLKTFFQPMMQEERRRVIRDGNLLRDAGLVSFGLGFALDYMGSHLTDRANLCAIGSILNSGHSQIR